MLFRVVINNDVDIEKWSQFVVEHSCGNIFQTHFFYKSCLDSKEWEPIIVAVSSADSKIHGLLVNYIQKEKKGMIAKLSSRDIVFGGPLIANENPEVFDKLITGYLHVMKGRVIYSQFRNLWDISHQDIFNNFGFAHEEHLNILVNLEKSEEQLWKDVHSKRRNEIRRAKKEGTVFSVETSPESLLECYNIIKEVYSFAKLPYPSLNFFKALFDNSGERIGLKLFTAKYKDKIIGCMLALVFKDTIYDFFAGSYRKFYNKYPNDLIPWEVFLWGKQHGYKVFDFGGAGKPGVPYGVRDYKKKFGGEFVNFGRYQKIHKPLLMKVAKLAFKLWQILKGKK
jgi:hypothetical protein